MLSSTHRLARLLVPLLLLIWTLSGCRMASAVAPPVLPVPTAACATGAPPMPPQERLRHACCGDALAWQAPARGGRPPKPDVAPTALPPPAPHCPPAGPAASRTRAIQDPSPLYACQPSVFLLHCALLN